LVLHEKSTKTRDRLKTGQFVKESWGRSFSKGKGGWS